MSDSSLPHRGFGLSHRDHAFDGRPFSLTAGITPLSPMSSRVSKKPLSPALSGASINSMAPRATSPSPISHFMHPSPFLNFHQWSRPSTPILYPSLPWGPIPTGVGPIPARVGPITTGVGSYAVNSTNVMNLSPYNMDPYFSISRGFSHFASNVAHQSDSASEAREDPMAVPKVFRGAPQVSFSDSPAFPFTPGSRKGDQEKYGFLVERFPTKVIRDLYPFCQSFSRVVFVL